MKWSPQQDKALVDFKQWYEGVEDDVFYLYGYAGTGKTSIALHLTEGIDGKVIFAAFTGKAASVMRKRGCSGAQTLHSLLYNVKKASQQRILDLENERAELMQEAGPEGIDPRDLARIERDLKEARQASNKPNWELNPFSAARDAALIVIDECSMVDARLGADLRSFGKPILVLGDPAQLPPVKGAGFFNVDKPQVMLTEVHRHALDNPVLHLATKVRKGERLEPGSYGESRIVARSELQGGETLDYDQILVGRNATRQLANRAMRQRLGYAGTYPIEGEKLVCLKNSREDGFLNGTIWYVNSCHGDADSVELTITSDEGTGPVETLAYSEPFRYEDAPRWGGGGLNEFTYGYALTTHKAQGSEWEKVYIVDESSIARGDAGRWLYTAITRASEKLLLVR